MRRNRLRLHASMAALAAAVFTAAGVTAEESCVTCHADVRTLFVQSVHATALTCVSCHGGDPGALGVEEAHSPARRFVGTPSRLEIPALCGDCHSDPRFVKPFGLSTDQYAQYRTSTHGLRLADGDSRVAICTDCHGTHDVLRGEDPRSGVAPENIAVTCGHCHSDPKLMEPYGIPADQAEKFVASVHGRSLLVDQHPRAPTCATCHGAHGAVTGEKGTIGTVCGQCHPRTLEYFSASPHHRPSAEGAMSECASCHGYHDTEVPTRALFDTVCVQCHAPDSRAFSTGEKLKTLLSRAEESLEAAEREIDEMEHAYPTVVRFRPRLRQATAHLMEALTVQHSLALDRTDDLTRSARSISEEVRAAAHGVGQERQVRYLVLTVIWVFLLFAIGVALLYKRELGRGEGAADERTESHE